MDPGVERQGARRQPSPRCRTDRSGGDPRGAAVPLSHLTGARRPCVLRRQRASSRPRNAPRGDGSRAVSGGSAGQTAWRSPRTSVHGSRVRRTPASTALATCGSTTNSATTGAWATCSTSVRDRTWPPSPGGARRPWGRADAPGTLLSARVALTRHEVRGVSLPGHRDGRRLQRAAAVGDGRAAASTAASTPARSTASSPPPREAQRQPGLRPAPRSVRRDRRGRPSLGEPGGQPGDGESSRPSRCGASPARSARTATRRGSAGEQ